MQIIHYFSNIKVCASTSRAQSTCHIQLIKSVIIGNLKTYNWVEFQVDIYLTKIWASWKQNSSNHYGSAEKNAIVFGCFAVTWGWGLSENWWRLPTAFSENGLGLSFSKNTWRITRKFSENCWCVVQSISRKACLRNEVSSGWFFGSCFSTEPIWAEFVSLWVSEFKKKKLEKIAVSVFHCFDVSLFLCLVMPLLAKVFVLLFEGGISSKRRPSWFYCFSTFKQFLN